MTHLSRSAPAARPAVRGAVLAPFLAVAGALALVACGGTADEAGAADDTVPAADSAVEAPAEAEAPAEQARDGGTPEPAETKPASGTRTASGGRTSGRKPASPPAPAPQADTTAGSGTGTAAASEPEATPRPRMATLEPGTTMRATVDQELSTQTNQVGDTFTATVSSDVVREGEVVVPSGAELEGEVTAVQKSGKPGQAAVLKLNFSRVSFRGQTYPVSLAITEAQPVAKSRTSTGEAAGRIGVGAAAGAVLGRVIGGDAKGTLIGAAVGAAAGTAVVLTTRDADAVLPAGAPMTLRLEEPLVVRLPAG